VSICFLLLSRAVATLDTSQGQLACGGETWQRDDNLKKMIVPAALGNNSAEHRATLSEWPA
jgi:hypothetical protein